MLFLGIRCQINLVETQEILDPFFFFYIDHVYSMFYHRISGDFMTIYMNIIDMYWHAIWKRLVSDAIAEEIFTEDGNTNTINHLV